MPVESFILQHYPRNDELYFKGFNKNNNATLTIMHSGM